MKLWFKQQHATTIGCKNQPKHTTPAKCWYKINQNWNLTISNRPKLGCHGDIVTNGWSLSWTSCHQFGVICCATPRQWQSIDWSGGSHIQGGHHTQRYNQQNWTYETGDKWRYLCLSTTPVVFWASIMAAEEIKGFCAETTRWRCRWVLHQGLTMSTQDLSTARNLRIIAESPTHCAKSQTSLTHRSFS